MPIDYRRQPVVTIKWVKHKPLGQQWHLIIRGYSDGPIRLEAWLRSLGNALAAAELHLRWWGYDEIAISGAIANTYRSLRQRYGKELKEYLGETKVESEKKEPVPYPD